MYYFFAQFYPEENGGYSVMFPDLPGCVTCGEDLNESMDMAIDALTSYLETSIEDGESLPSASDFETAKTKSQEYSKTLNIPPLKKTLYLLVPATPQSDACIDSNISLQPELLAKIDAKANDEGLTRSSFLAAAAMKYINELNAV